MSSCVKCQQELGNMKEVLKCTDCAACFHQTCTREKSKKLSAQRKTAWKCDSCVDETASSVSRSEIDTLAILESIQSLKNELGSQIGTVNKNVEGIITQLGAVNATIKSMQSTMNTLVAENEDRKSDISSVKQENIQLKAGLMEMEGKCRELEQYSRKDNLEVVGIPFSRGENLHHILGNIARLINIDFKGELISTAHRLPATKDRPNPAIIVRLSSRDYKAAWISAARNCRKRLTAAELSDSWESTSFYINDHLTPWNKAILGRARQLVRQKKIAFAWSRDCRILARKSADVKCPPTLLRTMEDLDRLIKDT